MAIIVKCDKCGVTAENHQDIKVVDDKPGDYHQRWALMFAGSGMDLYPEHLFDMDAYKPDLGALLCHKCSEEYKKYKWGD
jgi:hypothetical protein